MGATQLKEVFEKIPESKAWYLEYIEQKELPIPDAAVPLLQALCVCLQRE